jgi:hypothetical protein
MSLILRPSTAIAAALFLVLASNAGSAVAADAQQEANRKVVLDFYEKGLNQKDADAAIALMGNRYVQHNPNAADLRASANSSASCAKNSRIRAARSSAHSSTVIM